MNYETEHIVTAIKDARVRKGFSQRELSANSGVPQAQISKFENGSVDLRISSLVALVRALDLELELVPRKAVPAVKSIVRSTAQSPTIDPATQAKAQETFENFRNTMEKLNTSFSGMERLGENLQLLEKIRIPSIEIKNIENLIKKIEAFQNASFDTRKLSVIAQRAETLRNQIAHAPALSEQNLLPKPAYSLDEEDDDA